ncbi:MAG TPA: 16S rRNA (guanine(966)-N(2))-methyltransferase RsmD [Pyrinomonadaceae bacterium]|nr:16S rRNA (guanine(966)-N(2))-methyltransferase RsmD [Pyrinomonadaceae bacterium]
MRIIAGKYRRRVLKSPPSLQTRPTSDRLRESLFNVLAPRIDDETRFLDLCSGTGAIGIEALSRGARHVTFVDKSRKSCGLIEENLDLLEIPEAETEVAQADAEEFLRKTKQTFDIVYYDPPYKSEYRDVLYLFGDPEAKLLAENGILIAEHHNKNNLPDAIGELRRWRILRQGDSSLSFYERS